MIEAESRPYRFQIDKMINFESSSDQYAFKILPFKTRIVEKLEFEIESWYEEIGSQYRDEDNFEEKVREQIEILKPLVINSVGVEMMSKSTPELYFIAEELKFEIHFSGFEPFEVEVPISQIETFKEHFNRIKYDGQQITFNELEKFVVEEISIYDPVSDAIYAYQKPESQVRTPDFEVSLQGHPINK